jgi:hypothetical protein
MATVIGYSGISEVVKQNVSRIVKDVTEDEMRKALSGVQDKINSEVALRVSKLVCYVVENRSNYSLEPVINIVLSEG